MIFTCWQVQLWWILQQENKIAEDKRCSEQGPAYSKVLKQEKLKKARLP